METLKIVAKKFETKSTGGATNLSLLHFNFVHLMGYLTICKNLSCNCE